MATTYNNLYLDLRTELRRAGDEEATQSARELVCAAAAKTREELVRDGSLYASPEVEKSARELVKRGNRVIRVPAQYTAEQILALDPDGVMLTNGPGDPAENTEIIENIRKIAGKLPAFGICLGHQLFALAMGGKTKKMKYGHRGANQPVKELKTGRVYITSQNHGYEVIADSIKDVGTLSFINANDNTCEGVEYPELNAFTVQFHPEACAGPLDARGLFDKFMVMMDGGKKNA